MLVRSGLNRPRPVASGSTGPRLENELTSFKLLLFVLQPRSVSLDPIVITFLALPGVPIWSTLVVPHPDELPLPLLPAEKNAIRPVSPMPSSQMAEFVL